MVKNLLNNPSLFIKCFILFVWIVVYIVNSNLPISKAFYYVNTDAEFLHKFDVYNNSSRVAVNKMNEWVHKTRSQSKKKLFNQAQNTQDLFCVGLITKERKGINTILPSIASLLTRIRLKYENTVDITVFNVDDDTNRADLKNISNLVNIEQLKNSFGSSITPYAFNPKVREEADYAAVMKRLYEKKCLYGLILEDDAIATWDWYEKTINSIDKLNNYNYDWFCLKLFTSFQSFDWLKNTAAIIKSIFFIIFFTLVQCLFLNYLLNRKNKQVLPYGSSKRYNGLPKKYIFLTFLHTTALKFYLNGSAAFPLGTGVHEFSQGFNTVAIVYPYLQLNLLSNYLEQHVRDFITGKSSPLYPKDLLINRYVKENHLKEYIAEPSFFQHIGVYSSLGTRGTDLMTFQFGPFESYSFEAHLQPIIFDLDF